VSSAERFVRYHKQQTDRALSQAYACLASDSHASASFDELLHRVRQRAPGLLSAPLDIDRHPGVDTLVNLARFRSVYVRPIADWPGSPASWRGAVSSLAQHLVGTYDVPSFLASSWFAADPDGEKKRDWFIAHARGVRFRSLDLPIVMTRKMEHLFLRSRDHLTIEQAMRRAELLALGAPDDLVHAVSATRLANDLSHGDFWRTVWMFLIAHTDTIDHAQVGPLIDFLQAIRHERPVFSMKGRTGQSMLRLMDDWHRSLRLADGSLVWTPSPFRPMAIEEPNPEENEAPMAWQLIELTNGAQLRMEGAALRHCVASYADRCWRGRSSIWSLRVRREEGQKLRSVLTIEVDLHRRAVIQARGWGNRPASGRALQLLRTWAERERLRLSL
jgi:PcfJ-like protein